MHAYAKTVGQERGKRAVGREHRASSLMLFVVIVIITSGDEKGGDVLDGIDVDLVDVPAKHDPARPGQARPIPCDLSPVMTSVRESLARLFFTSNEVRPVGSRLWHAQSRRKP